MCCSTYSMMIFFYLTHLLYVHISAVKCFHTSLTLSCRSLSTFQPCLPPDHHRDAGLLACRIYAASLTGDPADRAEAMGLAAVEDGGRGRRRIFYENFDDGVMRVFGDQVTISRSNKIGNKIGKRKLRIIISFFFFYFSRTFVPSTRSCCLRPSTPRCPR